MWTNKSIKTKLSPIIRGFSRREQIPSLTQGVMCFGSLKLKTIHSAYGGFAIPYFALYDRVSAFAESTEDRTADKSLGMALRFTIYY